MSEIRRELALLIQAGWRVIALETFEEARATRLLEQIAKSQEKRFVSWSLAGGLGASGQGAGSLDDGLRSIAAVSEPAVLALLDTPSALQDPIAVRRLRDLLPLLSERSQVIVLIGPLAHVPLELQREVAIVDLPLPRREELEALFRRQLEGADEAGIQQAVASTLGLTAAEATRVFRKACLSSGGLNDGAIDHMIREKRQALRRTPGLEFCESAPEIREVGGLGELKRWLRERRRAFSSEARDFGLPNPRGLLLLGVQGCGKSLCAKAIAREWQFPLLRLDLAEAFGHPELSPEAMVRGATAVAESLAPAILWIDEIEKGFSTASGEAASGRVFGSFLTWLSEKQAPVFVVATANDIQALPPELLRRGRFDDLFFVDLPNVAERQEIFAIHLEKRGRDPLQFPLEELANESERLSGAEIEQVVHAALYHAFAEGRELGENDLIDAITETVPLYETYEKRIKELRDWARTRARPATLDTKLVSYFGA